MARAVSQSPRENVRAKETCRVSQGFSREYKRRAKLETLSMYLPQTMNTRKQKEKLFLFLCVRWIFSQLVRPFPLESESHAVRSANFHSKILFDTTSSNEQFFTRRPRSCLTVRLMKGANHAKVQSTSLMSSNKNDFSQSIVNQQCMVNDFHLFWMIKPFPGGTDVKMSAA